MMVLRLSLFLIASHAAATADEGSLLQVEVNEHSAEAVQSALTMIDQQIQSMAAPDKTHRIAINTLMKTVAREKKLTPTAKATLQNVSALLSGLLPDLANDRDLKDEELLEVLAASTACNDASVDTVQSKKTAKDASQTNHSDCRDSESDAFTARKTACDALVNWLQGLTATDCNFPDAERQYFSSWSTLLGTALAWFKDQQAVFATKDLGCDDAQTAYDSQKSLCDTAQTHFESKFCQWHVALNDMCTTRTTCHSGVLTTHQTKVDSITPLSAQRVKDAAVITHVVCLIDNLVDGVTDLTECDSVGTDTSSFNSGYANTFPPLPTMDTCDTTPAAVHPGSATWFDIYATLPDDAPHSTTGISECV